MPSRYSSRTSQRGKEYSVIKVLLFVVTALNVFTSIWVCFYCVEQYRIERIGSETNARRQAYVRTWMIWVLCVVICSDFVSLVMLYGIWMEKLMWIYVYGILSFVYSIFAISCYYTRGSITAFVFPITITILCILYVCLLRKEQKHYKISETRLPR